MECKKQVQILYVVIGLLVIGLGYSIYSHSTPTQGGIYRQGDEGMKRFGSGSGSRMGRGERMGSGIINNFSPEQKIIIDELKKARESGDKDKEMQLMEQLRNKSNKPGK